MSEQVKRAGRPRKWSSEADRKRAYRARRAAELGNPLAQRRAAQEARRQAAADRSAAEVAQAEAKRWRQRAGAAEKRAEIAERRAVRENAQAQRLLAERDEARRLVRRKLQWAKHAEGLRKDPDALLVLVAELYAELDRLRKEVASLRQRLQRPDVWGV